ncbi:MAG: DUF1573 domain-containing protein, partial [Planctomycetes bacterium]|nr:DUF1573 domain-containing protein [Planctomycetota bacterium]
MISYVLQADVRGAMSVSPEQVNLLMGEIGERVEIFVDLLPTKPGQTIAIGGLELDAPEDMDLVVRRTEHPTIDQGHRIVITGMAPSQLGSGELGKLTIRTDVEGQREVVVPINGTLATTGVAAARNMVPLGKESPFEFDEPRHDFGRIREEDGTVSHSFRFTNTSTRTVTIGKVNASCSCIAGDPRKKVFKPGETGTLEVAFDPKARKGRTGIKPVTIVTDHPTQPLASVY